MIALNLHVFLLKYKDETFHAFKVYIARVENQLGIYIKILRREMSEYFLNYSNAFCEEID